MHTRTLGQGLAVSALGLGCMGMSDFYGPADDARSTDVIRAAVDRGITFFDSADMYGPFTNEILVGRALAAVRDRVTIATKFGFERTADGGWVGINGRPDYVRASCDASLSRLGVDHIDLYYQHRVDPSVPIEDTFGAMKELVDAGKVRYLGISEAAPDTIRRAHAVHPLAAVQTEWSLWTRDVEHNGVFAVTQELGIGFVPYSPLARGVLSGNMPDPATLTDDDFRRHNPRFQPKNLDINMRTVEAVKAVARRIDATPAQVAIAWLMAQGDHVVPIPGTRSIDRLVENIGAASVILDESTVQELSEIAPDGAPAGQRYNDLSDVYL
ncbi:aryl-alcohol dehydrogenase-like predicted oxidoreductase [Microbacteriaceae bacterium MWH-Ta3]|nr:aryl-alcohol dehydrogenase-like predicted oxidoreductase [Microbacteriaceae bacterium MWH-Ta3]